MRDFLILRLRCVESRPNSICKMNCLILFAVGLRGRIDQLAESLEVLRVCVGRSDGVRVSLE
jgi:hypothetical protein